MQYSQHVSSPSAFCFSCNLLSPLTGCLDLFLPPHLFLNIYCSKLRDRASVFLLSFLSIHMATTMLICFKKKKKKQISSSLSPSLSRATCPSFLLIFFPRKISLVNLHLQGLSSCLTKIWITSVLRKLIEGQRIKL